jgi:hypothetical protein
MMATLSYLSFLPDVVQRTAVNTAAAMAARASADTMPVALEVVPHLLNLLDDCRDTEILNSACSALNHITCAAARCAPAPLRRPQAPAPLRLRRHAAARLCARSCTAVDAARQRYGAAQRLTGGMHAGTLRPRR